MSIGTVATVLHNMVIIDQYLMTWNSTTSVCLVLLS